MSAPRSAKSICQDDPPTYDSLKIRMENAPDIELSILTPESVRREITQLEQQQHESRFETNRAITIARRREEDITEMLNYLRERENDQRAQQTSDGNHEEPPTTRRKALAIWFRNVFTCTSQAHTRCRESTEQVCLDYRSIAASVSTIALVVVLIWCGVTGKFSQAK